MGHPWLEDRGPPTFWRPWWQMKPDAGLVCKLRMQAMRDRHEIEALKVALTYARRRYVPELEATVRELERNAARLETRADEYERRLAHPKGQASSPANPLKRKEKLRAVRK